MRKHGSSRTPQYSVWKSMQRRCTNPRDRQFARYGGRGIRVCERWSGDLGLQNFLADMGQRPSPQHSVDRIDPNGNYEPSNCRWATAKQQMETQRLSAPRVRAILDRAEVDATDDGERLLISRIRSELFGE